MGYTVTISECERREKTHSPSKNRVGDFSVTSGNCAGQNITFVQYPCPENEPTPTTTASGVRYYGYRFYSPGLGRWINRDPIGERGGLNIYSFLMNSSFMYFDYLGALAINISDPTVKTGTAEELDGAVARYDSNDSLSCKCVGSSGGPQKLECTLAANPFVYLSSSQDMLDFNVAYWNGQAITVEQHELNHHKVFLNVFVPSYKNLVSPYEKDKCCNCSELLSEVMSKFDKLKKLLRLWEKKQEYFSGMEQKQPFLDYGGSIQVMSLKDKTRTPCK